MGQFPSPFFWWQNVTCLVSTYKHAKPSLPPPAAVARLAVLVCFVRLFSPKTKPRGWLPNERATGLLICGGGGGGGRSVFKARYARAASASQNGFHRRPTQLVRLQQLPSTVAADHGGAHGGAGARLTDVGELHHDACIIAHVYLHPCRNKRHHGFVVFCEGCFRRCSSPAGLQLSLSYCTALCCLETNTTH